MGSAIILMACANKKALYAIKMMALPVEFGELGQCATQLEGEEEEDEFAGGVL